MAFIYKKEKLPDYFHSENIQLDFNKSTFEKDEAGMKIIGIITLEDLIEFWLKIPIMDEEDYLHIRGRSRSRSRRRSIFDIMINSNLQNRLNQLYDSTRSSNRANTIRQDNSLILNNNYQQMNDQNDEETEKLNPK
jgi:hypothetical protein